MTTTPQRVALYLRLSEADRDPYTKRLDTTAIDRQRRACREWAERHGWTITAEYADNNVSATKDNVRRPGYEALVSSVEADMHDGVLCSALDRLSRRMRDRVAFLDLAEPHGLFLATPDGSIDISTIDGQNMFLINGVMAEGEIKRKNKRVRDVNHDSISRGDEVAGGRRPFGFRRAIHKERGRRVIRYRKLDDAEAEAIGRASLDALSGRTLQAIARDFNGIGLTTTAGNPWTGAEIRRMLTNPRNAGLLVHQGRIIGPAKWEPIIDTATHHALVQQLTDPSRIPTPTGPPRRYLLSGIVTCGVCGEPCKGKNYAHKAITKLVCSATPHLSQKMQPVEDHVTNAALTALRHRARAPWLYAHTPDEAEDLVALAAEADMIRTKLDALAAAFASDHIDAQQLASGSKMLRDRLADVDARRASARASDALPDLLPDADVRAVWDDMDHERRRAVIRDLTGITMTSPGRGAKAFNPGTVTFDWRDSPPHVVVSCVHRPDVAVVRQTNDDGTVRGWAPVAMAYNPVTKTLTWDEPPADPCCIPSDDALDDAVLHGRLSLP